jgi:hypothetical protein
MREKRKKELEEELKALPGYVPTVLLDSLS